jgi:hypothetical protein
VSSLIVLTPSASGIAAIVTAMYTVSPTSTTVERNVPSSGAASSLARMRSRSAATNQISANRPSPVRIQPRLMSQRLLS